jgi:two-component system sensor histidine kinase KdpD
LEPHVSATAVADVLGPVVRHARTASRQRVDVDVPDDLPPVLADPVRLEQILSNLLDNACRYAPGSPVLVAACQAPGEHGPAEDVVEIRVVDHGPGIPPQERERVFDQFYRLKGGGRQPEGTGMGLAICRGIVRMLSGDIRLETTPGGGATVVVTLPVASDPVASEPAPARPRP